MRARNDREARARHHFRTNTQPTRDPTGSESRDFSTRDRPSSGRGPVIPPTPKTWGTGDLLQGSPSPSEIVAAAAVHCPLPRSPVDVPQLPAATPDL